MYHFRGGGGAPGFEPDHVVYKELRVIGSLGVDYPAYRAAVDLLASRRWPFEQLSRRVVGFDDLPALLDVMSGADTSTTPPLHGVVTPPA